MAEPAYKYPVGVQAAPEPWIGRPNSPELEVVPRIGGAQATQKALVPLSVKVTLTVAILMLATVPFIKIWLANDTMRMLVDTAKLEQEISSSRAESHRLESRYSAMTNPQTIQRQAIELGMVPDPDPVYMRAIDNPDQLAWNPYDWPGTGFGVLSTDLVGAFIGSRTYPSDNPFDIDGAGLSTSD